MASCGSDIISKAAEVYRAAIEANESCTQFSDSAGWTSMTFLARRQKSRSLLQYYSLTRRFTGHLSMTQFWYIAKSLVMPKRRDQAAWLHIVGSCIINLISVEME